KGAAMIASPETAPVAVNTRESRGVFGWLRRQLQFSLATLIDWMLAFAAATAFAFTRTSVAAPAILAVALLVIVVLHARRRDGRRVLPYIVFVVVIGAGYVAGVLLLREVRIKAALKLVDEAEDSGRKLEVERSNADAAAEKALQKSKEDAEAKFIE